MFDWLNINWAEMFSLHRSPIESFLRASAVYLSICILLRVLPKRQAGSLSPNDLIVLVLVGGIATTALEEAPMSIVDVLIVILTILFWSIALDWLAFRFPPLRPYLREPPTLLIKDGKLMRANLRKEMITEDEVRAELRTQGLRDIEEIQQASLEADGTISVVKKDPAEGGGKRRK